MQIEFFFDFSCPFAFLASREIEAIARRTGADLVWRPVLLGGILRAIGAEEQLATQTPQRLRHNQIDQLRWAELRGIPLAAPAAHPQRTVRALRTLLAVDDGPPRIALVHAVYSAYWERAERIDDEDVLRRALAEAGVAGSAAARALAADGDPAFKDELRRRTDEAIARGVFGAPTFIVGAGRSGSREERLFWGQDRMEQLEAVLAGWDPSAGTPPSGAPPTALNAPGDATIDFWFDYSSPFSYLAATRIEAIAARTGARLRWRPMLLGAVFKQIGQVNVPMFTLSESKRRWMMQDMALWSAWLGAPFRFPRTFPQKTVTALRLALLAGDRIGEVSHALFRAVWVEDRDVDQEADQRAVLERLGLDAGALLARTRDADVKQALIDSTAEAVATGVFGAPSFVVSRPGAAPRLYWGQDRLDLVERAAAGVSTR